MGKVRRSVLRGGTKVRNEFLIQKMKEFNISSVAELARKSRICETSLLNLVNKELYPQDSKLRWRPCVKKIAKFFLSTPYELFGAELVSIASDRGKKRAVECFNVSWEDISFALRELPARERDILSLRFGLGESAKKTLEETKKVFKISTTRISEIEKKAIRKMRYRIAKNKKKMTK